MNYQVILLPPKRRWAVIHVPETDDDGYAIPGYSNILEAVRRRDELNQELRQETPE
jgi:hypothetical protein